MHAYTYIQILKYELYYWMRKKIQWKHYTTKGSPSRALFFKKKKKWNEKILDEKLIIENYKIKCVKCQWCFSHDLKVILKFER